MDVFATQAQPSNPNKADSKFSKKKKKGSEIIEKLSRLESRRSIVTLSIRPIVKLLVLSCVKLVVVNKVNVGMNNSCKYGDEILKGCLVEGDDYAITCLLQAYSTGSLKQMFGSKEYPI
ncbi:hypothetical protein Goklo_012758, partial [Gossypium klotzschianum]|nr:hypothetical protein [Gossypium klotzschianum]